MTILNYETNYLANQLWELADRETERLMLRVAAGKKEYAELEEIERFPCPDLKTIDYLWVKYSYGKWGFSEQMRIWKDCGCPMSYDNDWNRFGDRVGWRKRLKWLNYRNLTFLLEASSPGELPFFGDVGML